MLWSRNYPAEHITVRTPARIKQRVSNFYRMSFLSARDVAVFIELFVKFIGVESLLNPPANFVL